MNITKACVGLGELCALRHGMHKWGCGTATPAQPSLHGSNAFCKQILGLNVLS